MFLRRMLFRYWATYVSITLFTLVLMLPVYAQTYRNAKIQQMRDMDTLQERNFDALVAQYNTMMETVYMLRRNRDFVLLSSWGGDAERINLYHYIRFQKALQDALLTSDFVMDAHVWFRKSGYVVSKRIQAMASETFYQQEFNFFELDFAGWQDRVWRLHEPVLAMGLTRYFHDYLARTVCFYQYSGSVVSPSAVIGMAVNENTLHKLLMTPDLRDHGRLTLSSGNGTVLLSHEANLPPGKMDVFQYQDDATGLKLRIEMHGQVFAASTAAVRNTLFVYIGIAMAFSLLLSYAYTRNVYKPVKTFYDRMQMDGNSLPDERNFNQLLNVSLTGLLTHKRDLEASLSEMRQRHLEQLLGNLVHDLPVPSRDVERYVQDLPVLQTAYVVARVSLQPLKAENEDARLLDTNEMHQGLQAALQAEFGIRYQSMAAGRSAIIGLDEHGLDGVVGPLEELGDRMQQRYACAIAFAVSRVCQGLAMLRGGYAEATQAQRFAGVLGRQVIRSDQIQALGTQYDLVVFQPEMLLSLLGMADTHALTSHLDTLFQQLKELHYTRPRRAEQLHDNIVDTCTAALIHNGFSLEQPPREYHAAHDIHAMTEALRALAMETNKLLCSQRQTPAKRDSVLDYIKAHFTDPELSLSALSRQFFYSEGYISQIVKKQTGLGYAEYLGALRMDLARSLLLNTDTGTGQIAQMSGFNNLSTFYKSFKKNFGMSPSAYREQFKAEPAPPEGSGPR